MSLFIAYNHAPSTGTGISAGTSYATGAKVAIQLDIPSTVRIKIVEWGISFDGSAAATPAIVELVRAGTASTCSSAHSSSSTVFTLGDQGDSSVSRLGYGTTTDTGYGNGAITSAAADRTYDKQYIAPTSQYVKMWPLGREPIDASGTFVQLRVNTSATVNAVAYIVWEELTK